MMSHSARVRRDIGRWLEAGLIDAATAAALAREVEANERRAPGFGAVLAMMAALLAAAAILIFVAANWEAMPRLARVAALFGVILGGYVGGAVAKSAGRPAIGEALWMVAAAAFGGSIALIGQMYHMSGDESAAMLTWCAGTALAAVALRSGPLTVAAMGTADAWLAMRLFGGFGWFGEAASPHLFVPVAAALFAASFWTRSRAARHLVLLSAVFYCVVQALDTDTLAVAAALALASAAVFAAAVLAPEASERLVKLDGALPLHGLVGFLAGMALVQAQFAGEPGFAVASAVALAGIAAALVLGGRRSRGLRRLAYLGFTFELCLIYAVTMESMLGTAGFFLAAALILAAVAFAILRIERRMASAEGGEAAP